MIFEEKKRTFSFFLTMSPSWYLTISNIACVYSKKNFKQINNCSILQMIWWNAMHPKISIKQETEKKITQTNISQTPHNHLWMKYSAVYRIYLLVFFSFYFTDFTNKPEWNAQFSYSQQAKHIFTKNLTVFWFDMSLFVTNGTQIKIDCNRIQTHKVHLHSTWNVGRRAKREHRCQNEDDKHIRFGMYSFPVKSYMLLLDYRRNLFCLHFKKKTNKFYLPFTNIFLSLEFHGLHTP